MNTILKIQIPFALIFFLLTSFTNPPAEIGNAIVLDENLQGKKTACELVYDKSQLTAAHKTLRCGTKVKVTNLENNKTVEVTIIERGPYIKGQVIAISTAAATIIGMTKNTESRVKLEVVEDVKNKNKKNEGRKNPKTELKKDAELNVIEEAAELQKGGLYKMQVLKLEPKGWGVQVAGYSSYESVVQQVAVLQKNWFKGALVYADQKDGKPYYKIIMGPFFTREEADSYSNNLKEKFNVKDAFVVDLNALK
jgi:rare lipoprotein A